MVTQNLTWRYTLTACFAFGSCQLPVDLVVNGAIEPSSAELQMDAHLMHLNMCRRYQIISAGNSTICCLTEISSQLPLKDHLSQAGLDWMKKLTMSKIFTPQSCTR